MVREESDWVSDISVTGSIHRRRQQSMAFSFADARSISGVQSEIDGPGFAKLVTIPFQRDDRMAFVDKFVAEILALQVARASRPCSIGSGD